MDAQIKRELTRRQVVLDDDRWKEVIEMVRESNAITHVAVQEVLNGYIMANISRKISQDENQEEDIFTMKNHDTRGSGWFNGLLKRRNSFRGIESRTHDNHPDEFYDNNSLFTQKYNKEDETISSAISRAFRRQISVDDDDSRASTIVRAFRRQKSISSLPDYESNDSQKGVSLRNSINAGIKLYRLAAEGDSIPENNFFGVNDLGLVSSADDESISTPKMEETPKVKNVDHTNYNHPTKYPPNIIKPIPIRKPQQKDNHEDQCNEPPTISIANMQKITGTESTGSWAKMQKRMSDTSSQMQKVQETILKENIENIKMMDNAKANIKESPIRDIPPVDRLSKPLESTFSTVESIEQKKSFYLKKVSDFSEVKSILKYSQDDFQNFDNETINDGAQTVNSGKTESVFYDEGWRLRENDDTVDGNTSDSETDSESTDAFTQVVSLAEQGPKPITEYSKSEQAARSKAFSKQFISESFDFPDTDNAEDTISISDRSRRSSDSISLTLRQKISDPLSWNKAEEKLSEITKGARRSSLKVSPTEMGIGIDEQIKLEKQIDGKIAESIRRRLLASNNSRKKGQTSNKTSITKQIRLSKKYDKKDSATWDDRISGGIFPTKAIDELFDNRKSSVKETKFRSSLGPTVFVEDKKKNAETVPRRRSEGLPSLRKSTNSVQRVTFGPFKKSNDRSFGAKSLMKPDTQFRHSLGPAVILNENKKKPQQRRRSEGIQALRRSLDPTSRVSFDFSSVNEKLGKLGEGAFLQSNNRRKSNDLSDSIRKRLELLSDPEAQFEKGSSNNRINLMALASLENAYENASDDESMSTYSYAIAKEPLRGNSTRLRQSLFQAQSSDEDLLKSKPEKLDATAYMNQMGKNSKR